MTVKVFQINSNTAEAMYPDSPFNYGYSKFDPVEHLDKYQHVADLAVSHLDAAFQVGNIGPEYLYTRHAPMHSVSVGDILELNGTKYVVNGYGYDKLEVI